MPDGIEIEGKTFTVKRGGRAVATAKLKGDRQMVGETDKARGYSEIQQLLARLQTKPDQELIQGTWRGSSASVQGAALPEFVIKSIGPTITFAGNKVTWRASPTPEARDLLGDRLFSKFNVEGIFHLDPTKSPRTIDLTVLGPGTRTPLGTPAPRALLGIYRLDGDTLEICMAIDPEHAEERPRKFDSKSGKFLAHVMAKRDAAKVPPTRVQDPGNAKPLNP